MRDCYVGDIGDFANHGLLRVLCGTPQNPVPDMRLGIIWYRNEGEDNHGNHIGYLNRSEHNCQTYRACDPDLYFELQMLVGRAMERNERRRIADSIGAPILPNGTLHHAAPVPRPPNIRSRRRWFHEAMAQTAECDVVFLNPDIGIDWNRQARLQYVHRWELEALLAQGKVLVIYQHQQRRDSVANNARRLRSAPLAVQHLWACTWQPVSRRAYFIAATAEEQRARIQERMEILQNSSWVASRHFRVDYFDGNS